MGNAQIFHSIPVDIKDIISANCMTKVYLKFGAYSEALQLYNNTSETVKDDICHRLAITVCAKSKNHKKGKQIYSFLKHGFIEMFGAFNDCDTALTVFESISKPRMNALAMNAILTAFMNNKRYTDLLKLY